MKRLLPALLLGCALLPGHPRAAAPPAVSWSYVVSIPSLQKGLVDVDWTLRGLSGEVQICADMNGAERYVQALYQVEGAAQRRIERPRPEAECWVLQAPGGRPLHLRYRYDLARLAAETGDPDYASRMGDDFIFNDQAVLLRPDPLPRGAPIEVELRLPPGARAATPWQRLPGPEGRPPRFRYDSDHYDGGSYVAVGRLRDLGELAISATGPGGATAGVATLTLIDRRCRSGDEVLRRWVEGALSSVARFYGEVPGRRVHIILAPAEGSGDAGVFGTILRRGPPSVVLFLGADGAPERFAHDWMAVHELFHLGNARVRGRPAWFIEGFTTYYQDVLRGRPGGGERPLDMWGDLHDGLRRHCDPVEGVPLRRESQNVRRSHRYTRVYWGGACVAFLLDVAIRERSAGKRSLDQLLLELRRRSQERDLGEEEIIAALEAAAGPGPSGRPLVRELIDSDRPLPYRRAYERLGIEPTGPETVRLRDDAPLSHLRRSIM